MADWKAQLAEHPVVQRMGIEWSYNGDTTDLCPEFVPAPVGPWNDIERDCE